MAGSIRIHAKILDEILNHARREPLTECCGLLAGRDGIIDTILPAKNAMNSATLYEIAPKELFQLFHEMREQGLTHLGQYHSHLHTENVPSPTDIAQAGYPNHAYFIATLIPNAPSPLRAFSIRDGKAEEIEISVTNTQE
ncbi:MAG TPA: M67 family metallopeptidase [Candidatus Acidoferrales bacterium]|jgi:proteasome lid subunit RPN8/RPN11|nr:M67 family metallopeptidase [Candidatus Acidoferrales bacterium]